MDENVQKYRDACLALCDKILYTLEGNREDADQFCSGEIRKAYVTVNDKVAREVRQIKAKLHSL